jgi:hypothetical protein
MVDVSVGQTGTCRVQLRDQAGDPTEIYDSLEGVEWVSTNPDVISVADTDAMPTDAEITFSGEGSGEIECRLDGAPGGAKRLLVLRSETINVHPAGAFSGAVEIVLQEQPA